MSAEGLCSTPATRDKISALQFEQDWLEVLRSKNTNALECMLAPEFKETSWKGELRPKAQVLRELPQRSSQYQQKVSDADAAIFGDTAVVHGINVISDAQGHEVMRIRFTDVLRFDQGRWTAVAAQESAEHQQ